MRNCLLHCDSWLTYKSPATFFCVSFPKHWHFLRKQFVNVTQYFFRILSVEQEQIEVFSGHYKHFNGQEYLIYWNYDATESA